METYEVRVFEVVSHTVEVEADSEEQAYDVAYAIIVGGSGDDYETEAEGFTGDYDVRKI